MDVFSLNLSRLSICHLSCITREQVKTPFRDARDKAAFLYEQYRDYLGASVLDVGCRDGYLRLYATNFRYIGIDISGSPDVIGDLNCPLPFASDSFECVLCMDVLEHLDDIEFMFAELVRISRRLILVSLPNCWLAYKYHVMKGARVEGFGGYGLPTGWDADGDAVLDGLKVQYRHRWHFNIQDAKRYVYLLSAKHLLKIVKQDTLYDDSRYFFGKYSRRFPPLRLVDNIVTRLLWGGRGDIRYENLCAFATWFVLEKQARDGS